MPIRELVPASDPRLRRLSAPVTPTDIATIELVQDMLDTMYNTRGVGLAAVQIGVLKQVVVIDLEREGPPKPQVFLNPRILELSGESKAFREGCLSLPGTMIDVVRPQRIKISYANLSGDELELTAEGILAICLQHEIDHLNGILITDHSARIIDDTVH